MGSSSRFSEIAALLSNRMKIYEKLSHNQHRRARPSALRAVLSLLISVFLLLGQTFPANAGHGGDSSAAWVEICSDGGSYLAQLDQSDNEQMPECAHCSLCLVPSNDLQSLHALDRVVVASIEITAFSYSVDQVDLPDEAEKKWSACRGPPIASAENNMDPIASLSAKKIAGSVFDTWSIPCV